jgi:hypothetical protein
LNEFTVQGSKLARARRLGSFKAKKIRGRTGRRDRENREKREED